MKAEDGTEENINGEQINPSYLGPQAICLIVLAHNWAIRVSRWSRLKSNYPMLYKSESLKRVYESFLTGLEVGTSRNLIGYYFACDRNMFVSLTKTTNMTGWTKKANQSNVMYRNMIHKNMGIASNIFQKLSINQTVNEKTNMSIEQKHNKKAGK